MTCTRRKTIPSIYDKSSEIRYCLHGIDFIDLNFYSENVRLEMVTSILNHLLDPTDKHRNVTPRSRITNSIHPDYKYFTFSTNTQLLQQYLPNKSRIFVKLLRACCDQGNLDSHKYCLFGDAEVRSVYYF